MCSVGGMNFSAYSEIWRFPAVRQAVLLGVLGKAPWFGVMVVLTLHVVGDLGQGYASAGALSAVFTVAVALASPLRGRLLDTLGLRRTLAPSLILLPLGFIAAPFLGYWALMAVMAGVGLLAIPWFVLTRQLMLAAVPHDLRRPALALDSVVTEVAFMGGPTLGIVLATTWSTGGTLTALALASVSAAAILTFITPPLVSEGRTDTAPGRGGIRSWMSGPVLTTFVATVAVSVTLAGTDLGIVAASRAMGSSTVLAVVIVVWGAGSLVGGFVFGGLPHGAVGLTPLIAGLAIFTALGALGSTPWLFAILMALAGLFCAPSIAAISERLGEIVPEASRGEAFGWQGTFNTLGSAMAPPVIGSVMDSHGWQLGLVATGAAGLALAALGWIALRLGRRGVARHRMRNA